MEASISTYNSIEVQLLIHFAATLGNSSSC